MAKAPTKTAENAALVALLKVRPALSLKEIVEQMPFPLSYDVIRNRIVRMRAIDMVAAAIEWTQEQEKKSISAAAPAARAEERNKTPESETCTAFFNTTPAHRCPQPPDPGNKFGWCAQHAAIYLQPPSNDDE